MIVSSDRTPKRITTALGSIAFALGEFRRGYKTDAVSRDAALICPPIPLDRLIIGAAHISRHKLGPLERWLQLWVAALAAEPDDLEDLLRVEARRKIVMEWVPRGWDADRWHEMNAELSAERDRRGHW